MQVMGSGGLVEQSRMSISVRETSAKRDYHDHQDDNCEAEDLSMPVRKKLKGISPVFSQSNVGTIHFNHT